MQKIHHLPPHLIAQISAGEVIERPAYAVKELVENAIDAGADYIQIILEDAGLKKIMVIDNGEGMSRKDIQLAWKHHTTSKLSEKQSLIGIKSFGFRGEALSSISSVSTMTIKSKTITEPAGTMLQLQNGTVQNISSIGMPQGTTIIVEQLFASTPVRKKFLKSQRTEFRHTMDVMLQNALSYPHIRFQLTHNNKVVLDLPKDNTRMQLILGNDIVSQMIPITQGEHIHVSIHGYIAKPHVVSSTTNKQYLFVNNRPITDRLISQIVKEAYGKLLDISSYPLFVIFIDIPHEMVDVNVHPRKEQIAFMNTQAIIDDIKSAISETLQKNNLTFQTNNPFQNNMPSYATNVLRDAVMPWGQENITRIIKSSDIVQVHNVYLITQTYNGILLIDQHAAHERILYEKFIKEFFRQKKQTKPYSLPYSITLQLSPINQQYFYDQKEVLEKLGFAFEEFGENTLKLTKIPLFFKDHNIAQLLLELCSDVSIHHYKNNMDSQSQRMVTFLACRSAIKAGDKLTKKQQKDLLEQLEKTDNNYTCPHGRPTKVEMSLRELHKLFKRT